MIGKRFFWIYSLVWAITGILLNAVDTVDWIRDSIVIRYILIPSVIIALAFYAVRQIPDISDVKAKRSRIAALVIGSSVVYTLLRGMIPDGILPDSVLVELFLKYLYSLALLYFILRTYAYEGSGETGKNQ